MRNIAFWCLSIALLAGSVWAEESEKLRKSGYDNDPGFAGPGSTTAQLAEDDKGKEPVLRFPFFDETLAPWFEMKKSLNDSIGLQLGFAYTVLYQGSSDSLSGEDDTAGSAIARLSGKWVLVDRGGENEGALVFSLDHRHSYTDGAPADLGFASGYLGIPGTLFSNADGVVGDLNWQQNLFGGTVGFVAGRYDPNDFLDVLGYANPWTTFQNLSILFNPSIALPDWSTGLGGGLWMTDQWYTKVSVNDANGTATDVQFFDDSGELYTTGEIGWSPSRGERYLANVHVTGWYSDEREDAGVEQSDGVAIGANWTWDQTFMAFVKAGWSDGSAPLYNESVTVGAIHYYQNRSDLAGIAVNWGAPSDDALGEQWTSEVFYRLQLAENLAITPSIQVVMDPALNPDEDELVIGSIRTRFTF